MIIAAKFAQHNKAEIRRHLRLVAAITAAGMIWLQGDSLLQAATDNWIAGNSNWNTPGNWDSGKVPEAGDVVTIGDNDTLDRTISYDYSGLPLMLGTLTVVNTGGGTNRLLMGNSSPVITANIESIGDSGPGSLVGGAGVLTQSSSINNVNSSLYIGKNALDIGIYDLDGVLSMGNSHPQAGIYVGYNGNGTINQTGVLQSPSSNGNLPIYVGYNAGSFGTYNLNGGTIAVNDMSASLFVGYGGSGSFALSGGSVSLPKGSEIYVGDNPGSTGSFDISSGSLIIPGFGSGAPNLALGGSIGSSGSMTLGTGNPFLSVGSFAVGEFGSGTFTQESGTSQIGFLTVGGYYLATTRGTASVSLTGGTMIILGTNLYVGSDQSTAAFAMSGGTLQFLDQPNFGFSEGSVGFSVGVGAPGNNLFTLSGGTISDPGNGLNVGESSRGSFIQTGGSNTVGTLNLGSGAQNSGSGSYSLSAGTLQVIGTTNIGGSGSFAQTGGSITSNALTIRSGNAPSPGTYFIANGTLNVGGAITIDPGMFTQIGGKVTTGSLTVGGTGSQYSMFGGILNVAGAINVMDGTASALLVSDGSIASSSLAVSYAGVVNVTGGGVAISGAIDNTYGIISVTEGSITAGDLTNSGSLSVSDQGSIALSGSFAQIYPGKLALGIQSLTSFNQIPVGGSISLAGTLDLLLSPDYLPQLGDTFPILVGSSGYVTGSFQSVIQNIYYGGYYFQAEYNPADNPHGVDVVYVPEPASMGVMTIAATALLLRRRRQHSLK